jgi:hypothetical protein
MSGAMRAINAVTALESVRNPVRSGPPTPGDDGKR